MHECQEGNDEPCAASESEQGTLFLSHAWALLDGRNFEATHRTIAPLLLDEGSSRVAALKLLSRCYEHERRFGLARMVLKNYTKETNNNSELLDFEQRVRAQLKRNRRPVYWAFVLLLGLALALGGVFLFVLFHWDGNLLIYIDDRSVFDLEPYLEHAVEIQMIGLVVAIFGLALIVYWAVLRVHYHLLAKSAYAQPFNGAETAVCAECKLESIPNFVCPHCLVAPDAPLPLSKEKLSSDAGRSENDFSAIPRIRLGICATVENSSEFQDSSIPNPVSVSKNSFGDDVDSSILSETREPARSSLSGPIQSAPLNDTSARPLPILSDVISMLKLLFDDSGMSVSGGLIKLESGRSFAVGFFLILFTSLCNLFCARFVLPSGEAAHLSLDVYLKLFLLLLLPGLSLVLVLLLLALILRVEGFGYRASFLTSGVIGMPLIMPGLSLVVFGFANFELQLAVLATSACFVSILTFTTFIRVWSCSSRLAFLLTPSAWLLALYISSILARGVGERWLHNWID